MEFWILGALEVLDGARPVEIAGSKRRAVLALLLLHANEVVRTERLVDDLWGERPPRNASAALHSHVSRLRKALGPEVLARREWGYVLRADEDSIDLRRFERLVAAAEPLPARERSVKLAEAMQLWRGPALADLANEPGLQTEIARLDELRLTTLERRIDADLEAGRNAELVGEIEALIAEQPLREHLRWQLILALYRADRQAEALEVYRETRRVLTEELGLEPSPALKELETAILQQDPALRPAAPSGGSSAPSEVPARRRRLYGAIMAIALLAVGGLAAYAATRTQPRAHRVALKSSPPPTTVVVQTPQSAEPKPATQKTAPKGEPRTTPSSRQNSQPRRIAHRPSGPSHASTTTTRRTAAVQSTPAIPKRTPRPPRTSSKHSVRIADSFDTNVFDGTIWQAFQEGTGFEVGQSNGQLVWTFSSSATPGGAYNNVGGHYGTLCLFPGNFNARVDYTVAQWPPGNGVGIGLWAFLGPTNIATVVSRSSSPKYGEQYRSWLPPEGDSVAVPDRAGSLRIARVKGVITTYFRHNGAWRMLDSNRELGAASIAISALAPATDWQGKPVTVAFDNFVVTAPKASCPPGAEPNG